MSAFPIGGLESRDQLRAIRGSLLPACDVLRDASGRRRARHPDVCRRHDPGRVTECSRGDHDPLPVGERLVPEPRAANRAPKVICLAPAVAALAVARDLTLLVME